MNETRELSDGPKEDPYIGVRSEIARCLGPAAFPGDKQRLVEVAKDNGANDDVVRMLDDLPADRTFETTQEIVDALPMNGVHPDVEFEA